MGTKYGETILKGKFLKAKIDMKFCLTFLVIREMQNKTRRCLFINHNVKCKRLITSSPSQGMNKWVLLYI